MTIVQASAEAHGEPVDLDADAAGYFEEQEIRDLARTFSAENYYAIGGRWEWSKFTPDQIVALVRAVRPNVQPKVMAPEDQLLREVFALCEATEDAPQHEPKNEHQRGFDLGRRFEAKQIRKAIGTWFQDTFCGATFMGEPVTPAPAPAPAHEAEGRTVIEQALTKATALDPSDSPASLTYDEAVAYQRGLAAAYQHALEMIPASAPAPAVGDCADLLEALVLMEDAQARIDSLPMFPTTYATEAARFKLFDARQAARAAIAARSHVPVQGSGQ